MPFTFKLSQRLARMKLPLAIAAAAFAACELPVRVTDPTPPNSPVVQIVSTPDTVTLDPDPTQQFAVYGKRKNGDSVSVSVAYAATGGIISGAGLYTAGQSAGTYQVMATQSGGTLASTAAVTISSVPVASVAVSPVAAGLTVGATTQLTATPEDSTGTALTGRAVTWATC